MSKKYVEELIFGGSNFSHWVESLLSGKLEKKNTEGLHLFFSHGSINREPNSKGKPTAHPLRAQAASLTTPSPHHITNDGARGTNEAIHLPFILFAFFSSFLSQSIYVLDLLHHRMLPTALAVHCAHVRLQMEKSRAAV